MLVVEFVLSFLLQSAIHLLQIFMSVCPFWAAVETQRRAGRGSCLNIITISHSSVYYTLKKGCPRVVDRMEKETNYRLMCINLLKRHTAPPTVKEDKFTWLHVTWNLMRCQGQILSIAWLDCCCLFATVKF